jgi:hypothetical protein
MMPTERPHVPVYLLGDADQETLDELVHDCRRLGARWPRHRVAEDPAAPPPRVFRITPHSAELIRYMSDYGD